MNKTDIIELVASEMDCSKVQAGKAVEAVIKSLRDGILSVNFLLHFCVGFATEVTLDQPLTDRGLRCRMPSQDYYKEACAVENQKQFPIVGFSTERRTIEHVAHIYNDERIHSYVCFACAQIKVDTGGCRSGIEFFPAA